MGRRLPPPARHSPRDHRSPRPPKSSPRRPPPEAPHPTHTHTMAGDAGAEAFNASAYDERMKEL